MASSYLSVSSPTPPPGDPEWRRIHPERQSVSDKFSAAYPQAVIAALHDRGNRKSDSRGSSGFKLPAMTLVNSPRPSRASSRSTGGSSDMKRAAQSIACSPEHSTSRAPFHAAGVVDRAGERVFAWTGRSNSTAGRFISSIVSIDRYRHLRLCLPGTCPERMARSSFNLLSRRFDTRPCCVWSCAQTQHPG